MIENTDSSGIVDPKFVYSLNILMIKNDRPLLISQHNIACKQFYNKVILFFSFTLEVLKFEKCLLRPIKMRDWT